MSSAWASEVPLGIIDYSSSSKSVTTSDGVWLSNTFLLERALKWTSLMIETEPYNFHQACRKADRPYVMWVPTQPPTHHTLSPYFITTHTHTKPKSSRHPCLDNASILRIWQGRRGYENFSLAPICHAPSRSVQLLMMRPAGSIFTRQCVERRINTHDSVHST